MPLDAIVGGFTSYAGRTSDRADFSGRGDQPGRARHPGGGVSITNTNVQRYLARIWLPSETRSKEQNGIDLGSRTAAAILAMRLNDGSQNPRAARGVELSPGNQPGHWRTGSNKLDSTRAARTGANAFRLLSPRPVNSARRLRPP